MRNADPKLKKPALLAVLLTLLFMYQADATIVNVAVPSIRADLGASGAQLELGRRLPPGRPCERSQRLDLPGAATLGSAVLLIILPLTLGREHGWPAWTCVSLAASVPLLGVLVAVERRRTSPLLSLHVIRRPAIAWGLWPQALAVATYYALLFTLAIYLQRAWATAR